MSRYRALFLEKPGNIDAAGRPLLLYRRFRVIVDINQCLPQTKTRNFFRRRYGTTREAATVLFGEVDNGALTGQAYNTGAVDSRRCLSKLGRQRKIPNGVKPRSLTAT